MTKLGFIGAGNMAGAIAGGVLKTGFLPASSLVMFDIDPAKTAPWVEKGCLAAENASALVRACRYVLLAVKPQTMPSLLAEIARDVSKETVLISIAAGISAEYIREKIGFCGKVVLVMPNTPLLLGQGASAIGRVEPIDEEEFSFVKELFSTAGKAFEIPASHMQEVIPVNGSSPAYLYAFADAFVREAAQNGLEARTALELFCQTMIGSAHMLLDSGKSPQELIRMVTSPGGTTLAGLEALRENGFEEALCACSRATIRRAKELGR